MKRYIFLIFIQIWIGSLLAQDTLPKANINIQEEAPALTANNDLMQEANDLYINGNYTDAAAMYERLLKEKGESALVYYNLGNAYYKANDIAPAILNYERALLLDPGNGDIRFNLEMTKLKTVDKIEPVGDFFFVSWMKSLQNIYSTNEWSVLGIITFLIFIGCLVLFFFSRKIILKKIGFYAGIVCLVLTIVSNIFSYQQKKKLTDRHEAIIFVPTVTLKGSPDKSGTDIVVLHEGTKVSVKSKLGGWNEVLLEDGNTGWIESRMIEII